jgi:hypothetical protein
MTATIYQTLDQALTEVHAALDEERGRLAAYRQEFSDVEKDSVVLGGETIALGLGSILKKFSDILIRSDVGVADVAWSLHESADEAARRVSIEQARARKVLEADFADILREVRQNQKTGGTP